MHCGKDFHGSFAWVCTGELGVDVQDSTQAVVQELSRFMRQIEIDHWVAGNTQILVVDDVINFTAGDISGDEVFEQRVFFFQKIIAFVLRDFSRVAVVVAITWYPDAPPFTTGRLAHQPEFVLPGDGRGMNLDELPIGELGPLHISGGGGGSGIDNGIGGSPINLSGSAGGQYYGICL